MATLQELLNAQSAVADRNRAKDWSARNRAAFGGILDVNQYLPVTGDIQSGILAAQDLGEGAYGSAALNALGLLPFVPAMGGVVKKNEPKTTENLTLDSLSNFPKNTKTTITFADGTKQTYDRVQRMGRGLRVYHKAGKNNYDSEPSDHFKLNQLKGAKFEFE